jgi:hypothetical protein
MSIPEFQGTVPRVTQTQPDFDQNTQALLDWLVDEFVPGVNETAKAMNLNSTTGTSSTSNAIGTGAKTFTAETGKSWQPGMFIVIADAAAPSTNSMTAQVTSYNGGTGSLVVDVKSTLGSGTKSSWVISQTMNPVPLNGSVTNASVDKSIITGQSDETSPQPDDELLLSDKSESSGALNKIALANLLKVLNALTEDTNPDLNADYLLSYDASAAAVKKVLMGYNVRHLHRSHWRSVMDQQHPDPARRGIYQRHRCVSLADRGRWRIRNDRLHRHLHQCCRFWLNCIAQQHGRLHYPLS